MTERVGNRDAVQRKTELLQEAHDSIFCMYGRSLEEVEEAIEIVRKEKGDAYAKVIAGEIAGNRQF